MGWGCVRRGKVERRASNSLAGVCGRMDGHGEVTWDVIP